MITLSLYGSAQSYSLLFSDLLICRYGDLFQLKVGPNRQYWFTDASGELVTSILNMEEFSGRAQPKSQDFGKEFVFFVRDLERAKVSQK